MRIFIFSLFLSFAYQIGFSQDLTSEADAYRTYSSMEYLAKLKESFGVADSLSKMERRIMGDLKFEQNDDYMIPVIFHVVYANEEQYVNEEKLMQQLEILNLDFGGTSEETFELSTTEVDFRKLEPFETKKADTRIRFCLPKLEGNVQAVNYVPTEKEEWDDFFAIKSAEQGVGVFQPEQYLNVWICNLSGLNAGFAQFPNGPVEFDGIVIDFEYLNNIGNEEVAYNGGHTLTHLIGNYLGLYPLWGEHPCTDDYVDDTPIHNAAHNTCINSRYVSTCYGGPTEMINNFMDNTPDKCLSMFTRGQKRRMQQLLSPIGPRGQLNMEGMECMNKPLVQGETNDNKNDDISSSNSTSDLKIFPNPVKSTLFVSYELPRNEDQEQFTLKVLSITGELIRSEKVSAISKSHQINVQNLASGIYIITIENGAELLSEKFIVQ